MRTGWRVLLVVALIGGTTAACKTESGSVQAATGAVTAAAAAPAPAATEAAAPGLETGADPAAATAAAPAPKPGVARIVFIDQAECCDCTRKRIDTTWGALHAAFDGTPAIPIERIHLDTQKDATAPYTALEPILAAPAIYFFDGAGNLLKMLQGEVSEVDIRDVLR